MVLFNFIVGVAMAASATVISGVKKGLIAFLRGLRNKLTDSFSEFIGDGSQEFFKFVTDKIENLFARKEATQILNKYFADEQNLATTLENILKEISEEADENHHIQKHTNNVKEIIDLSSKVLFKYDYGEILSKSQTYFNLKDEVKELLIELIRETNNAYNEYKFKKLDPKDQTICKVIFNSISGYFDITIEKFKEMLSFVANQNGGVIDFQAVANAKYAPKYIKNACPGCGYDGDRLLVNEKTGTISCAACGKSYDLVQYAEPEIYAEIVKKVEAENDEAIKKIANESAADVKEIKKQLTVYYSQSLTKNYLESCLKGQADQFHNDLVTLREDNNKFQDDFKKRFTEIEADFSSLQKGQQGLQQGQQDLKKGQAQLLENSKDILDFLKKKTEEDRQVVGHFSQKLDSLDKQVNSLYEYAKEMFPELSGKSDLILEYVQKLCSKEYYEEMSNALGTDINKAISMEMKNGYEHIQALNSTSVSQIISAIEDLKKDCAKEGGVDQKKIEDSIRNANVQLSGQITGLQSLVECNHKESRAAFKEIIRSQDEIKAILLARIGLKVESHDFEKMYKGEIPSEYLLDEGIGEPFPCPYCGVKEERRISADGYCKCKICGQKFLAVSPFFPADKFAREHDDFRATEEKIKDWRKNHEAKLENRINDSYKVTIRESTHRDGILIIPNTDCNGNNIKDINNTIFWQENTLESSVGVWDVKYLLFGESINTLGHNGGKAFNQLTELKAVIFYQEDNLTRIGENVLREFRKCLGSSTTIYGQRAQPVNWNLARED